jgi:hypothetical protein
MPYLRENGNEQQHPILCVSHALRYLYGCTAHDPEPEGDQTAATTASPTVTLTVKVKTSGDSSPPLARTIECDLLHVFELVIRRTESDQVNRSAKTAEPSHSP